MRGFEQLTSKPRCHLMQFHRLVMLKLVTVERSHRAIFLDVALIASLPPEDMRVFFVAKTWKEPLGSMGKEAECDDRF